MTKEKVKEKKRRTGKRKKTKTGKYKERKEKIKSLKGKEKACNMRSKLCR